jgi:translation initiation factor IF-2
MTEEKTIRLNKVAKEFSKPIQTLITHLDKSGFGTGFDANSKITFKQVETLASDLGITLKNTQILELFNPTPKPEPVVSQKIATPVKEVETKPVGNTEQKAVETETDNKETETISNRLAGPKILGKIDLPVEKKGDRYNNNSFSTIKDKRKEKEKERRKDKDSSNTNSNTQSNSNQSQNQNQKGNRDNRDTRDNQNRDNRDNRQNRDNRDNQQKKSQEKVELKVETPIEEIITDKQSEPELELIKAKGDTLKGLTILGNIQLPVSDKGRGKKESNDDKRKKRKRKRKEGDKVASSDTKPQNNNNQNNNQNQNNNNQNRNNNNNQNRNNNNQNRNNNNNQNRNNNNTQNNTNTQNNNNNQNRNNNTTQNNNNQNRNNNTTQNNNNQNRNNNRGGRRQNNQVSQTDVKSQIKQTLSAMSSNKGSGGKGNNRRSKNRRDGAEGEMAEENNILRVTEFVSTSELASLMNVGVNEVISVALGMGLFISINQRLDAEAIQFMASEFGYEVEFISLSEEVATEEEDIDPENLKKRAPIVTIMGHVDHGKTSLLDYIRKSNVTASESGGITQHIGAYDVITGSGEKIVFLDTPGHEAFTAMRARGAKVTDIVILVVAADDNVMPQTKEAINHAKVAGVPIVVAINKIDKEGADADRIRKELAEENVLVESWGGKYQDQEISAKKGLNIDKLLEKVLLEAEMLDLKADPIKKATGTVIEATLDKGKGYVVTLLVQSGALKVGDVVLAGSHYGKVKAMMDHRGKRVKEALPSTPVQVLGLDGAPQAGDVFKVMESEREAREVAGKREQILRAQSVRATKGMTLEELGRRKALGNFQELKLIIKGDVDGSVEALSDSLLKLSTGEIQVSIIHKAVGPISESDVMLASTSDAIIIAFQVRPSPKAKMAAEQEKVQIKPYSIIYTAIEEIKSAMEGMLAPKIEEVIVGNVEVRDVFKITKVGTVAGCYVTDGYVKRNNKVRLIRDGIVAFDGEISALKRFKDDVAEVKYNYECGISLRNFQDIKVGDIIECYEEREVKRTL